MVRSPRYYRAGLMASRSRPSGKVTGRLPCGFVFFFQAEDGIRVRDVTGVQTCVLPISAEHDEADLERISALDRGAGVDETEQRPGAGPLDVRLPVRQVGRHRDGR